MNKASKIILYADDDDVDDQELLKEAFHQIDTAIDIRIVSGGDEWLTLLACLTDQELPSLIILDYNMPDLTYDTIVLNAFNYDDTECCIEAICFTIN